jgi:hypothetical protein
MHCGVEKKFVRILPVQAVLIAEREVKHQCARLTERCNVASVFEDYQFGKGGRQGNSNQPLQKKIKPPKAREPPERRRHIG